MERDQDFREIKLKTTMICYLYDMIYDMLAIDMLPHIYKNNKKEKDGKYQIV